MSEIELRQDEVTTREVPDSRWPAIAWLVLVLTVAAVAAWEWRMRGLGLRAGDLDDGPSHWTVERRRLAAGEHDEVVIFGSSRILFDTDLDAWDKLTGRRPVQLALPGTNPRFLLRRFAEDATFDGLVVVGVTPGIYFSDFMTAFPKYLDLGDLWKEESPSQRIGHRIGLFLSRQLAFLDDQYRLAPLIERIDVPDRKGVRRPYMEVWKLSETFDDRQTFMWPRMETDARLQEHAKKVWMAAGRLPPPDAATIGRAIAESREFVARIRDRGGEVVFVRAPSGGALYERERTAVPRERTWDLLLRETGAFGIHFEDHESMQGLETPEWSHLSRASATRFTHAYVGVIAREFPWVPVRGEPESAR